MDKKRVSVRMDANLYNWLTQQAEKEFTTVSAIINRGIKDYKQATTLIEEMGGEDMVRKALQRQIEKRGEKDDDS